MQRIEQLILDLWREAGRHIEIQDFVHTTATFLARHLPLDQLIVRRFDSEHAAIATVAVAPRRRDVSISEHRRHYEPEEWRQVASWSRTGRRLRRGKRLTGMLGLILPPEIEQDVMAIPLTDAKQPVGALLLTAIRGRTFETLHEDILDKLREPFSVALENDRRVHEIAALREAAEADRGALLRRLGRTELGDTVVGEQTGLRYVMERVGLVSTSDVPVLILGETGTGKELIARAIHNRSERHGGPFIRVNCGAIPSELIDSQLFGHERGSFTGAEQSRQGWFERADRGTLFLDEIGELPLEAQVRFLRVLQDGFVERVGGVKPVHVDVRIVAATHRDLAQMVRESRFREDLWYRLAVFPILLPPLRERRDDIPDLAHHFAERAALRFGLPPATPTAADIRLLQSYDWPGNIRELGAVIDRAAILGDGKCLDVAKALGFTGDARPTTGGPVMAPVTGKSATGKSDQRIATLDEAMKAHIELALSETKGRIEGRRGAAALLQINPHTLRARMRKLGVEWSQFRED